MSQNKSTQQKVIVFDLDGVLFDSMETIIAEVLSKHPTMTRDMVKMTLYGNFYSEMQKLKAEHPAVLLTEEEKRTKNIDYSKRKSETPLFSGIKELLQSLSTEGYTMAINTSSRAHNCIPLLERVGVAELFDMIAGADISRSKVEKLKMMSEKYEVSPSDMLFITDTVGDVREAEEVGVPTLGVLWGTHTKKDFSKYSFSNLLGLVSSVSELKVRIDSFFGSITKR